MNDLGRDSLGARLRAGDPYQGESMLTQDAARIRARMRSADVGARTRPNWKPAAAAAADKKRTRHPDRTAKEI